MLNFKSFFIGETFSLMSFRGMRPTCLAMAVSAFVAGCSSGPDYKTPSTPDPVGASFVSQPGSVDSNKMLPTQWWKLYQDPTLELLVEEALKANTDLRVALANIDRSRAVYGEARSGQYPATQVSAGVGYGRDQTSWSGTGQAPSQWHSTGGLDIAYEVDLFGRVRRDIEAAQYDADAVAAAYDATRLVVVAETTRSYVDACAYGESMEITQSSIELAQKNLSIISSQQQVGAASRLDVERAGLTLARTQATLPLLRHQHDAALFELAALMGRTPSQIPDAAKVCTKAPEIAGKLPVGNGANLLRRRPDVRQAERRLAADTARIGVSVADLYPQITLGASVNYLRNDNLKGDRVWSFSLGPLISWSFPNTMVVRSHIAQAKAKSAASLASFHGTVLNALKEAEQSLSAYNAAMEQRDALIEARNRAASAASLADERYSGGSISYLNVLVAQASLIDARAEVVASDQRVGASRVSVFKALGGGW
ncbi:efflux transporter outer membrane subunit [Shewanella vesiculosa]|uniref:efflux transporter outer membrane subunit n=1 Tax=Shewanella vesiculosa TaxID=518738 RepID=UPI00384CF1EA